MTVAYAGRCLPPSLQCLIAIPAANEAELLPGCLAALAVQRDQFGAQIDGATFGVLLLANNCTDDTIEVARCLAPTLPFELVVAPMDLVGAQASAGWARKFAMDQAAWLLQGRSDATILTTDADTRADARWLATILAALTDGADAVAGYVEPDAHDYVALGSAFMARGRLEDRYLRLAAEIWALLDPRAHDPWPNHRAASGANLGVTLAALEGVGGVPPLPSGEDAAFVRALDAAGYRVRHAIDARVTTSCRLEGRAVGGAADTMRLRHQNAEADCDHDMEPAHALVRRAFWKGKLRRWYDGTDTLSSDALSARLRLASLDALVSAAQAAESRAISFADLWDEVEASSALLTLGKPLRPSDLPREITEAERYLTLLRCSARRHAAGPTGTRVAAPAGAGEQAAVSLP